MYWLWSVCEGLYRQQYCGCVFSERDRYLVVKKKAEAPTEKITRVSKILHMINNVE